MTQLYIVKTFKKKKINAARIWMATHKVIYWNLILRSGTNPIYSSMLGLPGGSIHRMSTASIQVCS